MINVQTAASGAQSDANQESSSLRRAAIITASTGIAHSVLLVLAFFLVRRHSPGAEATDAEIVEFIDDSNDRRIVLFAGIYLIPFAGIAYIWFTVALRMWLANSVQRLTPLFANLLLICGVIYVALLFCAGASMSVLAISAESGNVSQDVLVYKQFPQYGSALLLVFAMRMAAMMVFALSNIGKTHGILPRWFAFLGFVLGLLLLLTSSLSPIVMLLFPVWLLVLAVIMLQRARQIPKGESFVMTGGQRPDLIDIVE